MPIPRSRTLEANDPQYGGPIGSAAVPPSGEEWPQAAAGPRPFCRVVPFAEGRSTHHAHLSTRLLCILIAWGDYVTVAPFGVPSTRHTLAVLSQISEREHRPTHVILCIVPSARLVGVRLPVPAVTTKCFT